MLEKIKENDNELQLKNKDVTMYCLSFCEGNLNKVILTKVQGELRLNKNHPRLLIKPQNYCIGLEHLGKTLFINEEDAIREMNRLNNEEKINSIRWQKYYREIDYKGSNIRC